MSELYERDCELVRSILDMQAHAAMEEQSEDYQLGVALGDQVDLAYEALDRMCAALAERDRRIEELTSKLRAWANWYVDGNHSPDALYEKTIAALAPPTTEEETDG